MIIDPPRDFTITCSPSVTSTIGYFSPYGIAASASVNYSATWYTLEIFLGGGIGPSNAKRFLIGQKCSASLSSPLPVEVTAQSPAWSATGAGVFKCWNSAKYLALIEPWNNPVAGVTTVSCYFRLPEPATVSFSGKLVVPYGALPAEGIQISLSKSCDVDPPASVSLSAYTPQNPGPYFLQGYPANGVGLYTQPTPTKLAFYGVSAPAYADDTVGIRWDAIVLTPSSYGGGGGWNFVQKIDVDRRRTNAGISQENSLNGQGWALDTTLPYEPGPYDPAQGSPGTYSADGAMHYAGDGPATPIHPLMTWVAANEPFETWLLYRPPGVGSQFVPIRKLTWYWAGNASKDATGAWALSSSNSGWQFAGDYPIHPTWTDCCDYRIQTWLPPIP